MRLPLLTSLAKRLASTQNMNTTGESVDVQKEEDLSQEGNWFSLDELQPRKDLEWPGFCSGGRGQGCPGVIRSQHLCSVLTPQR